MRFADRLIDNPRYLLVFAACLSLLISAIDNYFSPVLNDDSNLYLHTARVYLDQGFHAAVDSYRWPFISILIGYVHQITGLTLTISGHSVIAIFYALLTCTFISIVRELGGSGKIQVLALLIIIIFPTMNDYRSYITRDAGFWLFTLLSLQQLMRFAIYGHYRHAVGWLLAIGIAILFRTEGLFIAALSPLAILADSHYNIRQRFKKTSCLYAPLLCIAAIALAIVIATPSLAEKLKIISELSNISSFFYEMSSRIRSYIDLYVSVTASPEVVNDLDVVYVSGLIGLAIFTPLHTLTFPYLALLVWPNVKKIQPLSSHQIYPIVYLLIILGYLLLFSFKRQFLTDRYCIPAALVFMLALPFYIERTWNYYSKSEVKFNGQKILIILLLVYSALDSAVSSGHSKAYIARAAEWIEINKPVGSRFMTNHGHIAIIGGHCYYDCFQGEITSFLQQVKNIEANFLAIHLKQKHQERNAKIIALVQSSEWKSVKSFSNEQNDRVIVLSLKKTGD